MFGVDQCLEWISVWSGLVFGVDQCLERINVWSGSVFGVDQCLEWISVWIFFGKDTRPFSLICRQEL